MEALELKAGVLPMSERTGLYTYMKGDESGLKLFGPEKNVKYVFAHSLQFHFCFIQLSRNILHLQ